MHRAFGRWLAGIAVGSLAALGVAAAPAQAVSVRAAAADGTSGGFTDACQPAVNGDVTCMAMTGAAFALSGTTGGTPQPLGPADLQSAYDFQSATAGAGQTVAVVSYGDYVQAAADMNAYRSAYGIAACTKASGCFKQVTYTGSTTTSALPSATGSGYDVADAVSMDMISAVCPNCHILLVEAAYEAIVDPTTTTDDGLGAADNEAVALGAKFIVDPWGGQEGGLGLATETSWDTKYFNHPGVAITAPSGDQGYSGPIYYPAASQYVIAVGGTDLQPGASGPRSYTETAWSGSGSGCAEWASKPAWQTDTGCSARRMLNDVAAAAADGGLGIAYDNTSSGTGLTAGQGDAFAAAIIAAAYALAGTPAPGSTPASYIYSHPRALWDITSGDNGTIACVPAYYCNAGAGYDGPTGEGTPFDVTAFHTVGAKPVAVTATGGTTWVFALGADGSIVTNSLSAGSSTWSGLSSLGGTWPSYPGALATSDGSVWVFAISGTVAGGGSLYYNHLPPGSSTWSGWTEITGPGLIGTPAAVQDKSGAIHVFTRSRYGGDHIRQCSAERQHNVECAYQHGRHGPQQRLGGRGQWRMDGCRKRRQQRDAVL